MVERTVRGKCSAKTQGRQEFIYCSGPCQGSYHCKCVNVGPVEYEILMQKCSSAFKCSDCTRRGTEDDRPIPSHRGGDSSVSSEASDKADESEKPLREDNLKATDVLIQQLLGKVYVLTSEVCYLKMNTRPCVTRWVSVRLSIASDGVSCASCMLCMLRW